MNFDVSPSSCLRLYRGGERMIVSGGTETGISRLLKKMCRRMIPKEIAYFQGF